MLDNLASAGINALEDKLDGASANQQPESAGQQTIRFFVSIVWFVVAVISSLLALYAMFAQSFLEVLNDMFDIEISRGFGFFSVALCLVFAAITFIVPFLRKKGTLTRSCGVWLLGDGLWWLYICMTMN